MVEMNWETEEVINWIENDETLYRSLRGRLADYIQQYIVTDRLAPQALYESFDSPPKSTFDDVDWELVETWMSDED